MPASAEIVIPQDIMAIAEPLIGTPYTELHCWDFARRLYRDGIKLDVPFAHQYAARDFVELWYRDDLAPERIPQALPQPYDLALFEFREHSDPHVGVIAPGGMLLHSTGSHGVIGEPFRRYAPHLLQLSRPRVLFRTMLPPVTPVDIPHLEPAQVRVRLLRSPILSQSGYPRELHRYYAAGLTIRDLLPCRSEPLMVWHNGKLIEELDYPGIRLQAGDELLVSSFWGSAGVAIAILVQIALAVAFTALSHALAPGVRKRDSDDEIERTQTFTGIRSNNNPGGVVPIIYGRHRVGLTRLAENVEYGATFFDVGQAGTQVFTIFSADGGLNPLSPPPQGGGRPLPTIPGIPPPPIVRRNIELFVLLTGHLLDAIPIELGDTVEVRGPDINANFVVENMYAVILQALIIIVLARTDHLDYNRFATDHTLHVSANLTVSATNSSPRLNWAGAICEGPISNVYVNSVEINGVNIASFPTVRVQTRLGTADQTPLPPVSTSDFFSPATRSTFAVGSEIVDTPSVSYSTTLPATGFALNIDFNQGLYHFRTSSGRFDSNRVTLEYRYRRSSGSFTAFIAVDFTGNSTVPVRVSIEKFDLALTYYVIEIRLADIQHDNPAKNGFTPTLTSVTEIIASEENFPGTALMQLENIKPNQLAGGSIDNVTVVIDGRLVRVGSPTAPTVWSQNPAWICMDLLRIYMNVPDSDIDIPAFTAWAAEADTDVMVDSTEEHQVIPGVPSGFNTRQKYTHAMIIDQPQREQSVIQELTVPSRVEMLLTGGLWSPRLLKDVVPLQIFSSANVLNLTVTTMLDEDEITVLQIQFNDETNNYERATLTWPEMDDWPDTVNVLEMTLPGVTHPDHIRAHAQWELNKRQIPHDVIRFETPEAPRLQPYDLFWFAHEQQGWGDAGRVALTPASTTSQIELDHAVTYVLANDPYHVRVRFPDGSIETRTVVTQGGDTSLSALPLTTVLSQIPPGDTSIWAYGQVGPPDTSTLVFRCLNVTYDEQTGRYAIEALEHIAAVYTDPDPQPPPTITTLPNASNLPPGIAAIQAMLTFITAVDFSLTPLVVLSWSIQAPGEAVSPALAPYDGAWIFRRQIFDSSALDSGKMDTARMDTVITAAEFGEASDYVFLREVRNGLTFFEDINIAPDHYYQYKVVPISPRSVDGFPAYVTTPLVVLPVAGQPQNLRLEGQSTGTTVFTDRDILFVWDPPAGDPITKTYRVEVWDTDPFGNFAARVHPLRGQPDSITTAARFHYPYLQNQADAHRSGANLPRRKLTIRVWAQTALGIESPIPAEKTVENMAPSMATFTPIVTPLSKALSMEWNNYGHPDDIERYNIRVWRTDALTAPPISAQFTASKLLNVVANLSAGISYTVTVTPSDAFGEGITSPAAIGIPLE